MLKIREFINELKLLGTNFFPYFEVNNEIITNSLKYTWRKD